MSGSTCDVLCIGVLVADILAPPLPRLPAAGELLRVDDLLLSVGGCAANAAIGLVKLGVSAAVAGKVGNDAFAGFIADDLRQKGVDVTGISVSPTLPTSRTVILPVIGEDRRFIHAIGANAALSLPDIDRDAIARCRVLYVGGYQILPRLDQPALIQLFDFARRRGIKTVLDVAGVSAAAGMTPFEQLLALTDVFLPNDDEAAIITGERDPLRQAQRFLGCGAGAVIITQGGDGFVAATKDRVVRAGVFPIDAVDPSGAGDAFDAGYIVGMLEGWDLERTLEFASAVGASACTRLGTTAGVFTRSQAMEFLANHRLPIERRPWQ
jgi:sugar/nucleoside kinase (ribokinase family)